MSTDPRLCLALDFPTLEHASTWVRETHAVFGVYKVGLELFCAEGRRAIDVLKDAGAEKIFLDLKLHDIPRTVARSVAALGALGVDYLTVHTGGGREMLSLAAEAAKQTETRLLGVTILTSLDERALAEVGVHGAPADAVLARAQMSVSAGVTGLVCSPREVGQLRAALRDDAFFVTPGIRLPGADAGDQKRISTPDSALSDGADLLVIGRTVTAADDRDRAIEQLLKSVQS